MKQIVRAVLTLLYFSSAAICSYAQPKGSKPVITGQNPSPLSTNQGTPITVTLSNLIVQDPDPTPVYPQGFTLELSNGKDYKLQGATVTPNQGFSGMLSVPVTIDDGKNKSAKFNLQINVLKTQNDPPVITGQQPLSMEQGGSIVLQLSQLKVTDVDNNYPADFSLTVYSGKDYTFNGTTITPAVNFSGKLTVPVSVNDGKNESNRFDLKIDVKKKQNDPPQITGQQALTMNQGGTFNIEFSHLIVNDPDNTYPTGFSLKVFGGKDYTFNGTTITPSANFSGQLVVRVAVNDGEKESNRFDLKIDVIKKQNVAPQITGQQSLTMNQGGNLTLLLTNLNVTDPDNTYPAGFTLKVFPGTNYSFSGTTISPSTDFTGQLTVPVTVNDGQSESNRFDVKIDVTGKQNVAPRITGQQALTMNQGGSFTLQLTNLTVTDPDNTYPAGFTLNVFPGTNYSFSATTISPSADFAGQLTVPVSVNDGQAESNRFDMKIDVIKKQNVAPQITGQDELKVNEDATLTLQPGNLKVTDPDNAYPTDFSIKVGEGANYTVSGLNITPAHDFSGELTVPITVNDGVSNSSSFNTKILVTPVNDPPVITGQVPLSTNRNTLISITLAQLTVTDPDSKFPGDFTMSILNGENYSVAGNVVSPAIDFSGMLSVTVVVNDGKTNSAPYGLQLNVVAPTANTPPVITGQREIRTGRSTPVTLQLSHLLVTDPDNKYPQGFALKVSPGAGYTLSGTTVTPSASIIDGTFSVTVRVNDGKADSDPFQVKIEVVSPTEKPRIIAQKELRMPEDSTLQIKLTDLVVTDVDDPDYPKGFSLTVLPSSNGVYSRSGNLVTPAPNLNGFIEVGVMVSDGVNTSAEFKLAILVNPVNDPPEFTQADTTALAYVPGHDALAVFETINVRDVDDDHLIMAEVGFEGSNYDPANDQLSLTGDYSTVRPVYDSAGRLFLIGYAALSDYLDALRSIEYNYVLGQDENGQRKEILPGPRTVYMTVSDGHLASATIRRKISMDLQISLDIPNAFTPNGDRQNDTWHIDLLNADKVDGATIRVFDKRGVVLYQSTGFEKDWDGIFNGQVLPVDTYYYTIDLDLSYTRKSFKGTVLVLH